MRYVDELTAAVKQQLALAYRTKDLFGWGMRQRFKQGYELGDFKADFRASVSIALVALPLALAIGVAVDVPPQYGLYSAIVAGLLVPLLGGSRFVVTGPTAGLAVVLLPIVHKFGLVGLLLTGFFAGIILTLLGIARFGRVLQFIPHPVSTGLTTGLACVLAVTQLRDALGLAMPRPDGAIDGIDKTFSHLNSINYADVVVTVVTLAVLLLTAKFIRRAPAALLAVVVAALGVLVARHFFAGFHPATIEQNFAFAFGDETISGIPPLPPLPALPWHHGGAQVAIDFALIKTLLPSAFAIAILTALSALTAAVVADGIANSEHEPNAELIALGIANMICPLFGGLAAAGAVARTAGNIRAGARSPLAAAMHALILMAMVAVFAPLFRHVPLASLSALLLVVAFNMGEGRHLWRLLRIAPTADVIIMLTCLTLTITVDIASAVAVSVVLAALLFMRRMAVLTSVTLETRITPNVELPAGVRYYEIAGPMFFGAAKTAFENLRRSHQGGHTVIISMRAVPTMDATGLVALESAIDRLHRDGQHVILTGLRAELTAMLERAGLRRNPGKLAFAPDAETAISMAVSPPSSASSSSSAGFAAAKE
jgi:sulfate permease, SulP family